MNFPKSITNFAADVANRGGRVFLVGGSVRDSILGIEPKDFDLEVFGLDAKLVESVANDHFPSIKHVGRSFPVWHVAIPGGDIDIALPRRERKLDGWGPNPHTRFEIEFDPGLDLTEALRRRDFTINSIALDVLSGVEHDPFDGRKHLSDRLLRCTNVNAFKDDPLRVLRAAQFIARFELSPHLDLIERSAEAIEELKLISAERKFDEFKKLLLKGKKPSWGLKFLKDCGALVVFPELNNLVGCPQDPIHHSEGDVFTHTCMVVDQAKLLSKGAEKDLPVVFAALCHDFGKPAATFVNETGKTVAHGHEDCVIPVINFLESLRAPNELIKQVVCLVEEHLSPVQIENPKTLRKLARKLDANNVTVIDLMRVALADQFGRIGPKTWTEVKDRISKFVGDFEGAKQVIDVRKPLISGQDLLDLGFKPGPNIGKMLKVALDLEDEGRSREEILNAFNSGGDASRLT